MDYGQADDVPCLVERKLRITKYGIPSLGASGYFVLLSPLPCTMIPSQSVNSVSQAV